jgi:CheY-like chemotaxis protein/ribosome-binding protein aMBF1 (putative translation factor)
MGHRQAAQTRASSNLDSVRQAWKNGVTHSLLCMVAIMGTDLKRISVPNVDVKRRFGSVVKECRSLMGISQEELAGRAGLHRTYVSDVERGARNVSLASIERLAGALEVSVSTLFARADELASDHDITKRISSDELVEILFVEDNADDVHLTIRALKHARISNRIFVVRDGAEALNFIFCKGKYAHRQLSDRPQMILLDLCLPKIDGLEVLRQLKADPRTQSIPVVVLTASRHDRDITASKRLGADAYIVKPVDFQNLSEVTPQLSLQWALLKPLRSTIKT